MNQHAGEFNRELLCAVLALPRSTLYYQAQPADDGDLRRALEEVALAFPRYGYRRMTAELQRRGWMVNHKRVLRLMREDHLLVQVRRFCRTTFSQHPYGRYPNLIKHLVIERPAPTGSTRCRSPHPRCAPHQAGR